jgi:molybdopterin converting factor small subunit
LKVRLKLYGVFRSAARSDTIELEVPSTTPTVRIAIDTLASNSSYEELAQLLIDTQTLDPRPNALIVVSGREINTLNGLETPLLESDELSLLPVAHGG